MRETAAKPWDGGADVCVRVVGAVKSGYVRRDSILSGTNIEFWRKLWLAHQTQGVTK